MNNKVKCIFCVVLFIASFGIFKSKLLSNNFEEFVCFLKFKSPKRPTDLQRQLDLIILC